MFIYLIRHGKTKGNLEKRYIGSTDEPLALQTIAEIEAHPDQTIAKVWCSPLLRCRQTAKILFPALAPFIADDLRECAFGDFENKNYEELKNISAYRHWINERTTPPNGENHIDFRQRCCQSFAKIMQNIFAEGLQKIAIVAHGGTIMSIMTAFALPERPFYDWQPPNNGGFLLQADQTLWMKKSKINLIENLVSAQN